jgi:hypothetical protein
MQESFRQFLDRLWQSGELVDLHQPVDIRHIATLVTSLRVELTPVKRAEVPSTAASVAGKASERPELENSQDPKWTRPVQDFCSAN